MTIKRFETNRLILRGVELKDIPSYQKNFNDYEVIRYLASTVPWPFPDNGVEEFLTHDVLPNQGKDRWVWGLFLREEPEELIGVVDLWRKCRPENRGFWLARKHWGKGLMTEACERVIQYAFEELGFERLVFANAVGNMGSRRVKEKTGANFKEIRPASFVDPDFKEHEIWELLKADWVKTQSTS